MDNLYVVYLLWDPRDGTVRYLGKTKDPEGRLAAHRQAKSRAERCEEWEGQLAKLGLCCQCAIVEEGLTSGEAEECERRWIEFGYKFGWGLTNTRCYLGNDGPWRKALEANIAAWDQEIKRRWRKGDYVSEDLKRAWAEMERLEKNQLIAEQTELERLGRERLRKLCP